MNETNEVATTRPGLRDRLLPVAEVAYLAGLTPERVRQLAVGGKLPALRVDGRFRVRLEDVRAFLRERGLQGDGEG